MIIFLMFLGLILSIVKANGWIVVPTFCVVFCWVTSFFAWCFYAYARGVIAEKKKQDQAEKKEEKWK